MHKRKAIRVWLANGRNARAGGQLLNDLYVTRSINNYEVDVLMKYSGWAWYSEWAKRAVKDPVTVNVANAQRFIYDGTGIMSQMSYLFKNNFEIAGRYSNTKPSAKLYQNSEYANLNEKQMQNYELV